VIAFSPKWQPKLLPVFGHILVLHLRLGRFSQKSKKNSQGHILEIFGVKVEKFKSYLNELQEFSTRYF